MFGIGNRLCVLAILGASLVGCSQSGTGEPAAQRQGDPAYLLAAKPENTVGVAEARKADSKEVSVEGLIGGASEPFIQGVAAFTIVDPAIKPCPKEEGCPTPWDYCCEGNDLEANTAMVKVIGADGNPVAKDARELLGVKELTRVVVQGNAERDEQGNLTVLASKVHLIPE